MFYLDLYSPLPIGSGAFWVAPAGLLAAGGSRKEREEERADQVPPMKRQTTPMVTAEAADRSWVLFDAEGKVVGRAASAIADLLRGKERPAFTPNVDNGNFVVVINAAKVCFTGKKWTDKLYHRHSGYPGGMKSTTAEQLLHKHPDQILRDAVWGMLPKNRLSRHLMRKLKIYPGAKHPHEAQGPTPVTLRNANP